jgi:hypothetical protein
MHSGTRHHLWPDPAAERIAHPGSVAGVTAMHELLIFLALIAGAGLAAHLIGLVPFLLVSGGATFGALVVGRLAAVSRDEARLEHERVPARER